MKVRRGQGNAGRGSSLAGGLACAALTLGGLAVVAMAPGQGAGRWAGVAMLALAVPGWARLIWQGLIAAPLHALEQALERLARDELDQPCAPLPGRRFAPMGLALERVRARLAERRTLLAENRYNAYLAQHDGLTGLPNRLQFAVQIDAEIAAAQARGGRVASVMIDIDRFKHINDRFGHEAGDAVLRGAASSVQAVLRSGEGLARFGGDEFAAFKRLDGGADELEAFLSRIEAALCAPIDSHGATIRPQVSIGYSLWPEDTTRREQLINNADLAMYRAKAGRARKRLRYDPEMDERARRRGALVDELAGAGARGELSVFYQPQHHVDGTLLGYEALLRWTHPQLGAIGPAEFVPLAEETGLIHDLGNWVLNEACHAAMQLPPLLSMAVNVSAVQLADPALPRRVRAALATSGLAPARLELEITETALAANRDRALAVLAQLRALGVRIAIDDFGVGYSSLDTVSVYPVDKIKIDRCFIHDFVTHRASRSLVAAIISIGQSLGVPVLAEGVESESQLALARELGCNAVQGFLFGQPQPLALILALGQAGALGARRRGTG